MARAALLVAKVIGVLLARLAARITGCERLVAIPAEHGTPQREVLTQILARRCPRAVFQTVLYPLPCLQINQALVLCLSKWDIPVGHFHMTRIDDTGQNILDALIADLAIGKIFGKRRLGFQKAFDFRLAVKPS
ncbi:hypothetical protein BKI51_02415 [Alphaproteobacteria bacterium AO1-B]|nr:hypothetical protein BKI51_02415 [Alphaproteobacteria bacterium AO1-B]